MRFSTLTAHGDRLAFSPTAYVIDPLFFRAAISASSPSAARLNDVAVSGAIPSPAGLSQSGVTDETLTAVVNSMAHTAREAGIAITGGYQVVQRGAADKLFQHHRRDGAIPADILGRWLAQTRDADCQRHAGLPRRATILNLREGLRLDGELRRCFAVLTRR